MQEYNTNKQRVVPIHRNGMFYDNEQFNFDMELGREYIEGDLGQSVILYQVDLSKTNQDQLYGEAKKNDIHYLPPIEIPCIFEITPAELRAYDKTKNLGSYQKMGKLTFGVYESTLIDYSRDIKVGDYIGVQVTETRCEYFQVENDGKNNYDNGHTMFGTKPLYRTITCSPVEKSVFNG